jgi:hypothetical protein
MFTFMLRPLYSREITTEHIGYGAGWTEENFFLAGAETAVLSAA